jgi:hypothetical protein
MLRHPALLSAFSVFVAATAFAQAGPGGDPAAVRARWKTRPIECAEASAHTIDGVNELPPRPTKSKGPATIEGADDDGAPPPGTIDPRVYEDAPHRRPKIMRAEDWLARLACGFKVSGIDPQWSKRDLLGSFGSEAQSRDSERPRDSRVVLARALHDRTADEAHGVLYTVALMHQCYVATEWEVHHDYLRYLHCASAVDRVPTQAAVERAAAAVFPGSAWHHDNLLYLLQQASAGRDQVVAAYGKEETRFPMMKQVLADASAAGAREFRKRHDELAEIYQLVDPITQRLVTNPLAPAPPNCIATLQRARAMLAAKLHVRNAAGVQELVSTDPLGYQISEALAYCYARGNQVAHGRREVENMKGGRRVANEEEGAYHAREDAIVKAKKSLGVSTEYNPHSETQDRKKLEAAIPPLAFGSLGDFTPSSLWAASSLVEELYRAPVRLIGDDRTFPLIVAAKKPGPGAVVISFKKTTYPWQDISCRDTNQVDRVDYSGSSARIHYRQACKAVGPVQQRTHQEPDVEIAAEDAKLVAPGMHVMLMTSAADGAVVRVWREGGAAQPSVVGGVVLK